MDKLKMHSLDGVARNIELIGKLFPNAITEVKRDGKVEHAIDFDVLRQELSESIVDGREERYQFTWPDKKKAMLAANAPITATMRPVVADSVGRDGTPGGFDSENLYIEGDNLEVLKLLQETYLGKVKMIYIDPPYNTGNDFVYEDDFAQSADEYMGNSGQYDEEGNRLVTNTESNGRFHTDWLNMIYPRLKIAKDLLADDGVIFVSIDDNEVANLLKICNEIFGEENLLCSFCWCTDGNFDNQAKIKRCHQYILMYAKREQAFPAPPVIDPSIPKTSKLYNSEIRNTIVKNGPKNPISEVEIPVGFPCDFEEGKILASNVVWPQYSNDIVVQNKQVTLKTIAKTGWSSKAQLIEFINNGFKPIIDLKGQLTVFTITRTGAIEAVKKRSESQSHVISVLNNLGGSQKANVSLGSLSKYFDFPKPIELVKYLIQMNEGDDFICLDFFSGSATTAHAVMQLNAEDGGHRKFIMVQLPEKTDEKKEAYKAGYKNICEIGKERIRRAGKKIKEDAGLTAPADLDIGFRCLRLDESNMKAVYYRPDEVDQQDLFSLVDNVKSDRTPEDLLFQVMLDLGVLLSSSIETKEIAGKKVFNVADGFLLACFDHDVTEETVKAIAQMKPYYAVFRDSSMANDSVATNFEQIFETYSSDTVRKVL